MGTTVSIEVRPPLVSSRVLDAVVAQLHDVDARFSTYWPDSEISRLARGEIAQEDCSLDVHHVLAACDHQATVTAGAFDARGHRTDGALDPSGFVKGWAIEEAAWLIDGAGGRNYWINAAATSWPAASAVGASPSRNHCTKLERGVCNLAPAAVDDQAVPTIGHLDDLGDPGVAALPLEGRVRDGERRRVVLLADDEQEWTAIRVLGGDLRCC